MGMIERLFSLLFGGGNVIRDTAQVFRENAENAAVREADRHSAALNQFASEFLFERKGWFDRLMDGINRIPRPALALGMLALFISSMTDPAWFAARMQGLALVPEPLWWLLGVIVSFYFGARHQAKSHDFQKALAATMARAPEAMRNIEALTGKKGEPAETKEERTPSRNTPHPRKLPTDTSFPDNAALRDWMASQ
ncbi:MAG: holin family protein [Pseudomonadota bacterium]